MKARDIAIALALLVVGVVPALTQQGPAAPSAGMADMMKMHDQMMARMKDADAHLDALVKEMNAAPAAAKVDKMAAVVTELVRHQASMHEQMGQMHQQMMTMMGGRGMQPPPSRGADPHQH